MPLPQPITRMIRGRLRLRLPRIVRRPVAWLCRSQSVAALLAAAAGFALCAGMAATRGIIPPYIADEQSYLLAADTFAHGRLTNPPHPLWPHFEAVHVLQQPTYGSMYPPAQGMALALGQALTGHAFVGVWLSVAAMGAAMCWMLGAFAPRRWALLGALVAVMQFALFTSWSRSYWGGAVAATGGALLIGALGRVTRRWRARDAVVFGAGLIILANSRPFEGLVVGAAAMAVLAWHAYATIHGCHWQLACQCLGLTARRSSPEQRQSKALAGELPVAPDRPLRQHVFRRVALPLALVLAIGAGCLGYYNWRVTGNPLLLPWQLHQRQYSSLPIFFWQKPGPAPPYRLPEMRAAYQGDELNFYRHYQEPGGLWRVVRFKLGGLFTFFLGPALALTLLALPWALRDRWTRIATIILLLLLGADLLTVASFPHYVAPGAALLVLVLVRCFRWWWRWQPLGPMVLIVLLAAAMVLAARRYVNYVDLPPTLWPMVRQHFIDELDKRAGKHLVIVMGGVHRHEENWVANGADIDGSRIVWAHAMSGAENTELLRYFSDRTAWILSTDLVPPRLIRYRATPTTQPDEEIPGIPRP